MKLFVTGASGFIAKHIVLQALNAGHSVTGSLRSLGRIDEIRAALAPQLATFRDLENLSFVALDLTRDAGWQDALRGHDALLHTASPFPIGRTGNADDLIVPARDGTRRALAAAADAGVTRVVLTSSCAAIWTQVGSDRVATEADWTDPAQPGVDAYTLSKTLAERSAWEIASERGLALTTINPSMVMGPPLDRHFGSSVGVVKRLLSGKDPMIVDTAMGSVDVRDVARMHILAAETPGTAGERFIANSGTLSMAGWGKILKAAYPDRKIPTRIAPHWVMRVLALFDPQVRAAIPLLGLTRRASNAKARDRFGITFISPEGALLACAAALVGMSEV
ncbi:MAG: NAD-dependent epimerase/dehydratase family protein [Rhodobacteraceae bacterium]|jgi:dihydroflavonol-4-reductase|nr:NAD-dependent epimerase/dehydratase family protein [Paracoccaceae bacterium]